MENHASDKSGRDEDRPTIVVLLVDDQRFVGMAVGRLLASEPDIDLHCCDRALDAVARANDIRPTIILQDLVLPDLDGLAMVRLFRSNPTTALTPIIVLSGNDSADMRAQASAAGADDYLVKLPAKADLVGCLRRLATGSGRGDPVDATAAPYGRSATSSRQPRVTLDRRVMANFRPAPTAGACDFTIMLIDGFLVEASSQVHALDTARLRLDGAALKSTAHSLKGSSMTIGATRLADLCTQVEDHLASDPGGGITPDLIAEIDQEFVRVRQALAIERQESSRP